MEKFGTVLFPEYFLVREKFSAVFCFCWIEVVVCWLLCCSIGYSLCLMWRCVALCGSVGDSWCLMWQCVALCVAVLVTPGV